MAEAYVGDILHRCEKQRTWSELYITYLHLVPFSIGCRRHLLEVVEECCDAGECFLGRLLYLDGKLDLYLGNAAQVLDRVEVGNEAYVLARLYCLAELHLVHTVVDHHLEVLHLDNLIPQAGQHRECEIAVSDGRLEWAFYCGTLCVNVNPLVVECGIGKHVDALLREFYIVGYSDVLAEQCGKFMIAVDDYFAHSCIYYVFMRIFYAKISFF